MSKSTQLKTVKLYGDLGKRFGKEFHLAVNSPVEAIKLLSANFKDFTKYFMGDGSLKYHIFVGKQDVGITEANYPFSQKEILKIVPVVEGSGDNPAARIVIGAALVYFSGGLASPFVSAGFTGAQATISAIGWSLALGGVTQLLFAPPTPQTQENDKNKPSYMFDGAVNTQRQGNPVPVGYGRLRVGSQMVSVGLVSEKAAV